MRYALLLLMLSTFGYSQTPPLGPGVSHDLAIWRAAHYSDVRYKLNLTLEKMSPVLKGTIEIRVNVTPGTQAPSGVPAAASADGVASPANAGSSGVATPIILDWRKIAGHEKDSTISNVSINGKIATRGPDEPYFVDEPDLPTFYDVRGDHLVFRFGVITGENVIKLDFTSPILTSGSAITRYVDKEDGAEYIYSLFVPSDASTAFPVFDQPDLKANFWLDVMAPEGWRVVSNAVGGQEGIRDCVYMSPGPVKDCLQKHGFYETRRISTYVFAFAAGPWEKVSVPPAVGGGSSAVRAGASPPSGLQVIGSNTSARGTSATRQISSESATDSQEGGLAPALKAPISNDASVTGSVFVRKSQLAKYQPHAAEVARLRDEGIKYLETYFDYKFPFPKYDLVLIPEFPFGGMEHAGATFLRESSVIFPTEPTKGDYISRANLIFHETAHQWFGDMVTMKWFDDLWLKEGFAEFMAFKTLEHVMPEANAWKVFYERNKQAAYATDSTKGTTPIYQPIANLSAAKSAYGNIVYRKAPSFLRQAEFYLGPDKFQTAVRAFLKKHEYANAGWEDLVGEFQDVTGSTHDMKWWAGLWVTKAGMPRLWVDRDDDDAGNLYRYGVLEEVPTDGFGWPVSFKLLIEFSDGTRSTENPPIPMSKSGSGPDHPLGVHMGLDTKRKVRFLFPNYQDYGYGIFLLDPKSREYVMKHIGEEKDPFLRSMMWGSLWDSVREGELDPKEYVELAVRQLGGGPADGRAFGRTTTPAAKPTTPPKLGGESEDAQARASARAIANRGATESDESIIASVLGRVTTAMSYYIADKSEPPALAGGRTAAASPTSGPAGQRPTKQTPVPPAHAGGSDLQTRLEDVLIERMHNAPTAGLRITFYRALLNIASTEKAREVLKGLLTAETQRRGGSKTELKEAYKNPMLVTQPMTKEEMAKFQHVDKSGTELVLRTKDRFDIVTRLAILGDADAPKLLADLERTETSDDAKRYAYAAHAAFATKENREKFWNDFVNNKEISESWIEAAMVPFNSIRHDDLSLPYLQRALALLPTLKRDRKIFFVNGWLAAFIGGQRSPEALDIVNKFLAANPGLDKDLRLKILENVDLIERAVKIRGRWK